MKKTTTNFSGFEIEVGKWRIDWLTWRWAYWEWLWWGRVWWGWLWCRSGWGSRPASRVPPTADTSRSPPEPPRHSCNTVSCHTPLRLRRSLVVSIQVAPTHPRARQIIVGPAISNYYLLFYFPKSKRGGSYKNVNLIVPCFLKNILISWYLSVVVWGRNVKWINSKIWVRLTRAFYRPF